MAEVELLHESTLRTLFYAVLKEYTVANIEMLEALGAPENFSIHYMDYITLNTHKWGEQFNASIRLLKESFKNESDKQCDGSDVPVTGGSGLLIFGDKQPPTHNDETLD